MTQPAIGTVRVLLERRSRQLWHQLRPQVLRARLKQLALMAPVDRQLLASDQPLETAALNMDIVDRQVIIVGRDVKALAGHALEALLRA